LNRSEPLPFQLDEDVREEVRLTYRYIDLRRDVMQHRCGLRHKLTRAMRDYLDRTGFIDLETPMLDEGDARGRTRLPRAESARNPASSSRCRSRRRSSSSC
jgi:aspartyl-tRNA synthetase